MNLGTFSGKTPATLSQNTPFMAKLTDSRHNYPSTLVPE
jgi:hypothetical protein